MKELSGVRVELSPSLDLWARGARFGTIRRIEKSGSAQIAIVKVDHPQIKKLQRVNVKDLSVHTHYTIETRFGVVLTRTKLYVCSAQSDSLYVTPDCDPTTQRYLFVRASDVDCEGEAFD